MPLTDPERLLRDMATPRIVKLWWALQPLRSIVAFMNSGAHPDDETSAMLAALGLRDGLALSYACANRGEGGQNDLGTEAGADLGVLRTAEMEQAADVLNMRLYWLSETPQDAIFDFGFSKSGRETLREWGTARTLSRFVDIVRQERPDILCPTFLDIPGQHGHHRAMTETAHRVMEAAADPDFPGSSLSPWSVSKLYLPAWSGAGQAYDDDLPPPPATVTVAARDADPITGWSWEKIGQFSRLFHRTQAMGHWVPAGKERDWPLHLAASRVGDGTETHVWDGLAMTLTDLADAVGAPALTAPLSRAQSHLDAAIAAFPDGGEIARHAAKALSLIRAGRDACPESARDVVLHRLDRKVVQLSHVLRLAVGAEVNARVDADWLRPGNVTHLSVETRGGAASDVSATPDLPPNWTAEPDAIRIDAAAEPSDPYPVSHDPAAPRAPAMVLRLVTEGVTSETRHALEAAPVVLPALSARMAPDQAILNRATAQRRIAITLSEVQPPNAHVAPDLPLGWTATPTDTGFLLDAPEDLPEDLYRIPLRIGGTAIASTRRIRHAGLPPLARSVPAVLRVRSLSVALPQARIGYIGGGNDRVSHWLDALGAAPRDLTDADLDSDGALAELDSIVVGIFALRFRPALLAAMPRLRAWVEAGGNLVTLYHRPWDNWEPDSTPPRRLEIGQPSLRWRVTDASAEVTHLAPDHPLLTGPNRIGPEDWAGWHKERGLYFAKSWDTAYVPLLEMADPDEAPHRGALLAANIGKGQHVHCALILHHQMEHLVPGAFRLMANLVAPVR